MFTNYTNLTEKAVTKLSIGFLKLTAVLSVHVNTTVWVWVRLQPFILFYVFLHLRAVLFRHDTI